MTIQSTEAANQCCVLFKCMGASRQELYLIKKEIDLPYLSCFSVEYACLVAATTSDTSTDLEKTLEWLVLYRK